MQVVASNRSTAAASVGGSTSHHTGSGARTGTRTASCTVSASHASQMPLSSSSGTWEGLETKMRLQAERWDPATDVAADVSPHTRMRFMHEQLDCFGPEDLLLGTFILLGQDERRSGGELRSIMHIYM